MSQVISKQALKANPFSIVLQPRISESYIFNLYWDDYSSQVYLVLHFYIQAQLPVQRFGLELFLPIQIFTVEWNRISPLKKPFIFTTRVILIPMLSHVMPIKPSKITYYRLSTNTAVFNSSRFSSIAKILTRKVKFRI